MAAREVWGIDLGRSAVKGVLLTAADGSAQILKADMVRLEGPAPDPAQEPTRDGRLWRALRKFQDKHHIHKTPVCVAIPAQNTFIRELTVARVARRKVEEMVRYEASHEIPFVLEDVVWDYVLFEETAEETTRQGLLFAVKKNTVQTYLQVFEQLEMGPVESVTIAPLALLSFLRLELGDQARALALDVGAENTNLLVLADGRFWLRNMLTGGNRVTALLQEEFGLEFDAAQKAKENLARATHAKQIMAAALPAVHELIRDVKTNLGHLDRVGAPAEPGATYLFGGGAKLPGLKEQLGSTLRQQFQDMTELKHVSVSPDADVRLVRANMDRLAVAVGAAAAGLRRSGVGVSFVPREQARAARVSRAKSLALTAAVVGWAIMLTLYWCAQRGVAATEEPLQSFQRLASQVAEKERDLAQALDRAAEEQALLALLDIAKAKNQPVQILNAVVGAFAAANRASQYRFQILGFTCNDRGAPPPPAGTDRQGQPPAAAPQPAPAESGKQVPMLVGTVRGRIILPRGGTPTAAYGRFTGDLMNNLRNAAVMAKTTGQATFRKGQRTVTAEQADWSDLVRGGDLIRALPAGRWYTVDVPLSSTDLRLTQPFAEEDCDAQYVICRVAPIQFNEQTLEFTIRFEVSKAKTANVAQLLKADAS